MWFRSPYLSLLCIHIILNFAAQTEQSTFDLFQRSNFNKLVTPPTSCDIGPAPNIWIIISKRFTLAEYHELSLISWTHQWSLKALPERSHNFQVSNRRGNVSLTSFHPPVLYKPSELAAELLPPHVGRNNISHQASPSRAGPLHHQTWHNYLRPIYWT